MPLRFIFDSAQDFGHTQRMDEDVKIEAVEDSEVAEEAEDPESLEGRKIAKVRGELNACRKEKQEYMDGWQRAKADYVNALKRFETDVKTSEFRGKIGAVETLLPAFDTLERAKEHHELPEGFLAIAKQIESAFAALGLEEVGKVGEKFNPALHEALGQDTVESAEQDDIMTAILERGWRVSSRGLGTGGDVVIRPAKVRVAHYKNDP